MAFIPLDEYLSLLSNQWQCSRLGSRQIIQPQALPKNVRFCHYFVTIQFDAWGDVCYTGPACRIVTILTVFKRITQARFQSALNLLVQVRQMLCMLGVPQWLTNPRDLAQYGHRVSGRAWKQMSASPVV
jgi:hypothetical protein